MQVKPSELRLGNFVNFKNREDIDYCEITSLDTGGYIHLLRNFKYGEGDDQPENIEDITTIILTEVWLLKFGFKKSYDSWGGYLSPILHNNSRRIINLNGQWTMLDVKINYVHQLQNLYFALTGEELIVK